MTEAEKVELAIRRAMVTIGDLTNPRAALRIIVDELWVVNDAPAHFDASDLETLRRRPR